MDKHDTFIHILREYPTDMEQSNSVLSFGQSDHCPGASEVTQNDMSTTDRSQTTTKQLNKRVRAGDN